MAIFLGSRKESLFQFSLPINSRYYLLPFCRLVSPGASVEISTFWHLCYWTSWPCQAGRDIWLNQEPNQPPSLSVTLFPSRQFDKPAAQCLSWIFWLSLLIFKNTSFTALICAKLLVTFFLNLPEITDVWQNIGVQGTSVLFLVGTTWGKIITNNNHIHFKWLGYSFERNSCILMSSLTKDLE